VLTPVGGLLFGALDPLEPGVFHHTLHYVVAREQSILQSKVVILIALLSPKLSRPGPWHGACGSS
jgi:hypothetical protein